jgi:DNA-directed RNA polymerase subunit RPC12/RpoP
MDIVFRCEHCNQELSVDESGAGVEIQCPSCGQSIVVPPRPPVVGGEERSPLLPPREEKHFKVPTYEKAPPVAAIEKPNKPLDVAAKESDRKMRVKTIRHADHVEVGKDLFDDHVSDFLQKVGEPNIVSIQPFVYTHMELASRQWISDYGIMIVYRG